MYVRHTLFSTKPSLHVAHTVYENSSSVGRCIITIISKFILNSGKVSATRNSLSKINFGRVRTYYCMSLVQIRIIDDDDVRWQQIQNHNYVSRKYQMPLLRSSTTFAPTDPRVVLASKTLVAPPVLQLHPQ